MRRPNRLPDYQEEDGELFSTLRLDQAPGSHASIPTLSFGDGDSGFYELTNDNLFLSLGGSDVISFLSSIISSATANSWGLLNSSSSAFVPSLLPNSSDTNTGIGSNASDQASLIAGGKEIARASYDGVSAEQLILNPQADFTGTATAPTLAFGDGDTGFYEASDDIINFSLGGVTSFAFSSSSFASNLSGGFSIVSVQSPANLAIFRPYKNDSDTGLGWLSSDNIMLLAGGVIAISYRTISSHAIQTVELNAGLTAVASGIQGDGILLSSYNEIAVVATIGDAVTMPTASAGVKITIINNGANACNVFPASGDDLGAGVDTAVSLASGSAIAYLAYNNTNWKSI